MPAGRPKFKIDYDQVEKLANIMCTQVEIASILGCSVDTLQRDDEFSGIYKTGLDNGRMSLRRAQYKSAMSGNATMQIWLGKQYLNQRDQREYKVEDVTAPIVINNAEEVAEWYKEHGTDEPYHRD